MEEQLISFETAKLAKDKGFNGYSNQLYYEVLADTYYENRHKGEEYLAFKKGDVYLSDKEYFQTPSIFIGCAPTQSLLQKYLREIHNIQVYVLPTWYRSMATDKQGYINRVMKDFTITENIDFKPYPTYEEALEQGLVIGLTLINK